MGLKDKIELALKAIVAGALVIIAIAYFQNSSRNPYPRYQYSGGDANKVFDNATGKIYFYTPGEGYYYYNDKGDDLYIKELPK